MSFETAVSIGAGVFVWYALKPYDWKFLDWRWWTILLSASCVLEVSAQAADRVLSLT